MNSEPDSQTSASEGVESAGEGAGGPTTLEQWHRLNIRMVWVDLVMAVLANVPLVLAVLLFGVAFDSDALWPLIGVTVFAVSGALLDILRWVFTRYRITDEHVIVKTGVLVRKVRSIRRERIRSVDIEAKLRHRVVGLRVVKIGAGQQSSAGESALALDAVLANDAFELRYLLLPRSAVVTRAKEESASRDSAFSQLPRDTGEGEVFERFRPGWFIYNVFNVWAYLMAFGLAWVAFWITSSFGFDVDGFVGRALDWDDLGWLGGAVVVLVALGVVGAIGMGVSYFVIYWNFELARVPGENGTLLRTRHGLFTTREVNRDDNRMRGMRISEPVFWRWAGVSDTSVITTGLNQWSTYQTMVLPRGPVSVTRPVAARVLGADVNPWEATLVRHPRAALRRRIWWATLLSAAMAVALAIGVFESVIEVALMWLVPVVWGVLLLAAVVAYRALGHLMLGDYVVMRSGLMSRATTVLLRSSISTIAVRESVLQRRLGLKSVLAATAAGDGGYRAHDVDAHEALLFASAAAPGLLDQFLVSEGDHD